MQRTWASLRVVNSPEGTRVAVVIGKDWVYHPRRQSQHWLQNSWVSCDPACCSKFCCNARQIYEAVKQVRSKTGSNYRGDGRQLWPKSSCSWSCTWILYSHAPQWHPDYNHCHFVSSGGEQCWLPQKLLEELYHAGLPVGGCQFWVSYTMRYKHEQCSRTCARLESFGDWVQQKRIRVVQDRKKQVKEFITAVESDRYGALWSLSMTKSRGLSNEKYFW